MAKVIYIRTSDGVIVRFDSPDALKTWLLSGRVSAADRYLDADQTWRPVADLLNVEGAFRPPPPESATTPVPASPGSGALAVSTPLPSPLPGAALTPAPLAPPVPPSRPRPPPPPVPTEPVTAPLFDAPPASTPAARVGLGAIRKPYVPTVTEPIFLSDEGEPEPPGPPPEPPSVPREPWAIEKPVAPPPRRPVLPPPLPGEADEDGDIENVPTVHLEDRGTLTGGRLDPELIVTPGAVAADASPAGPGPGRVPVHAASEPGPGPVRTARPSAKAWPTDVVEPGVEAPRRGHPVAWTLFVLGVVLGGGAVVLDQWGTEWGIPVPWAGSRPGEPDAKAPAPSLPVASPDPGSLPAAVPDPGPEPVPDPGRTPEGTPDPGSAPDAARPRDVPRAPPLPDRPDPAARPASAGSLEPSAKESGGFDGHMAAGQRAMATDPALALTHFQAAAQLAPGRPEPRTKMGDCEMRRGNASAAASQYQAALNAFPSYGPAIIGLARAHARLGHDADARDLYRKYLDVNRTGTNADEARRVLGETAP